MPESLQPSGRPRSSRPTSAGTTRYLISAAVAAAIAASALPQKVVAADSEALEEVTVTGSRIARSRDLEAPSPIATISNDVFQNTGSTGYETTLNMQPQFVPSNTQFTSGIQSGPTNAPGAANLNLRGLGKNRNLVLIDGRRPQPGDGSLAVDINTIPTIAVKSVEIITGGASAVYGPDAMAGVVNFVLKDHFQGFDVDFQRGQTFKSDGAETRISALMGMNGPDGKGNVMLGLEWDQRDPVFTINRDFYRKGWLDPGNPSGGFFAPPAYAPTGASAPTQAALDAIFRPGSVKPGTQIDFNADGTAFVAAGGQGYNGPLNSLAPGRFTAVKQLNNGTLDQAFTGGYVSTPLEKHELFGRGTYDFNDNISAFTDLQYTNVKAPTLGAGYPPAITIWQAPIPRYANDNTWLPPELVSLLNSRPVTAANPAGPNASWSLYQVLDYTGPISVMNTTDAWQATAGLKGKLPFHDWTWEAYFSRGNTHIQADYTGLPSLQRYQTLVAQPNFGKVTNYAPPGTPAGYSLTCSTGLPVFQSFTPDPGCLQAINDPMKTETDLRQNIAEANLQGALAELPAGNLGFSVGAAYRKEDFSFSPGNPVGAVTDNPVGLFASNFTNGSINVKEAYTELLVPIVKRLDLELGYRYSNFNTAGGTNTYKALFTWKPLDALAFRGGYQAATRAPNVAELFSGSNQVVVPFPQEDPCSASTLSPWGNVPGNPNRAKVQALCEALIGNMTSEFNTQTFNAATFGTGPNGWTRQSPTFFPLEIELDTGNPKVKPETGKTWTFGTVITEPFGVNRLTATVDYYRIRISDAIAPQSSITVYNTCFNSNGSSNPTYDVTNAACQLIHRDPITGDRAWVVSLYSNLGLLQTDGIDFTLNWATDVGPGTLQMGTSGNYLIKYKYQTGPTSPTIDAKGTLDTAGGAASFGGLYEYRTLSHIGYTWSGLTLDLNWEHKSSIHDASAATNPSTKVLGVAAYNLYGLTGLYNWKNYTFRAGIENLLDKKPPVVGTNPGVDTNTDITNPGNYDPLGRRFYLGVKASF